MTKKAKTEKPAVAPAEGVQQLLEALAVAERQASTNLDEVPFAIKAGAAIQIATARAEVADLRRAVLRATVPERLIAVFGSGPGLAGVEAFLADPEANSLVVRADRVYQAIADQVEPSFGEGRVWGVTQHGLFVHTLAEESRRQGGKDFLDVPRFADGICKDRAATVAHIRRLLYSNADVQVDGVRDDILAGVLAQELAGAKVLVLVTGAEAAEIPRLSTMFSRAVTHAFDEGFVPTQEALVNIIKS